MTVKHKHITWWQPLLGDLEGQYIQEALQANYINEGDKTEAFEQEIVKRTGANYCVATTSGTSSLFLSLKVLGIGPGDEVLVPDVTFIATANAVDMTGATPVFVDVDPQTLSMMPSNLDEKLTDKTKAIVPVHITGRGEHIAELVKWADIKNIRVVEDAAEAFLSFKHGKALGSFGALGAFSFSPNKVITTGQGGAIITNDEELYKELKQLKDQGRPVRGTGGADDHPVIGYNFKLTNLQAAVGLGQLALFDDRAIRMRRTHQIYQEQLNNVEGLRLFKFDETELPLWTDGLFERRDELCNYLDEFNIDCRKFWWPLHQQPPYRQEDAQYPVASELVAKALWLPSDPSLEDDDVHFVCEKIKDFYTKS